MGIRDKLIEFLGGTPKPKGYGNDTDAQIKYPSAIDAMKQYGFQYLKETDSMAERKARIRQGLDYGIDVYLTAKEENNNKKMQLGINHLYNVCQTELIPYFRTINNKKLLIKAKMFVFKYLINIDAPNAYDQLIIYVRYLIALWAEMDVTIPIPFIVQNTIQQPNKPRGVTPADRMQPMDKPPSREAFPTRLKEEV